MPMFSTDSMKTTTQLPSEELCFGADGNLRLYSYDGGTARNYKIS